MAQARQRAFPQVAGGIEVVRQKEARKIARRSFLRLSVIAGLALTSGAMVAGFLGFFNRRKPIGFGGVVTVTKSPGPNARLRSGALLRRQILALQCGW